MSELQIWPHVLAALTRSRDAASVHDSARYILSQLVIAFTGAGEMLAIGHVDGAADLLADVEPAPAAEEPMPEAAREPCPTCRVAHDPKDCCQA